MALAHDTIRHLLGEPTFSRGLSYAREGRVQSLVRDSNGSIRAKVLGSGHTPYEQRIHMHIRPDERVLAIEGICGCPVGFNCKHVAAALIALSAAEATTSAPGQDTAMAPAIRAWLARVRAAQAPSNPDEDYPESVRDRLLYVLDLSEAGTLTVTPIKATLKRDGSFGKSLRRYDVSRLGWTEPRLFVRPVDLRIVRELNLLDLVPSDYAARRSAPPPEESLGLLARIVATGRGRWREAHGPALWQDAPRSGRLVWRVGDDGRQRLGVSDAAGAALVALPVEPPAYVDPGSGAFGPLELDAPPRLAAALLAAPEIPPDAAAEVAAALGQLGGAHIPAPRAIAAQLRRGVPPVPVLRLFALRARQRRGRWSAAGPAFDLPALRLAFEYAGRRVEAFPYGDLRYCEDDTMVTIERDRAAESRAHARLDACGACPVDHLDMIGAEHAAALDRAFPVGLSGLDLEASGDDAAPDALRFTAETVPRLREEGWRVEIDPSWPYRLHEGPVGLRARLSEGDGGWFSIGLTLEAAGQHVDLAPLILSIIAALPVDPSGEIEAGFELEEFLEDLVLYQRLEDGTHVPLQVATLAPLVRAFLDAQRLLGGFHEAEAARVADLAEALDGFGVPFEGGSALVELGRRLRRLAAAPMAEPPAALEATLRPYQKTGYGWLSALADTGFGGVLADDMGLGKTVQTLALLVERHLARASDRPSLVIAPTSLVGTWRREAERFAPALKVLVLHGPDRHARFDAVPDHHVVVTTYPLLHRDIAALQAQPWDVAVLDEAQAVKNPASAAAKHIRKLDAQARVALTGTPMENSLEDLWTLFDWLIPGLLGNRKAFRTMFRTPIERAGDATAQAALNARIRPFLLRRTKAEVAAELPAKTEITELVTLGDRQRGLYETIRLTMDARVRDAIAARGLAASRITILDALLKLRQVCCDPALLGRDDARNVESAKRARLMELLEELVAEGRRVLVFSQFVSMLRLIEQDVKARGWAYAWLTGETKNRETVVAGFQDGRAPLFLISLKAGGVGLTLTGADTVILYDPWWNPAVERQAMDRAHRIGQSRTVFVYRLVAEGSVEQAIMNLQEKKQAMADALFDAKAGGPIALGEEDIAALFRPINM
jgi:hypothetical protein